MRRRARVESVSHDGRASPGPLPGAECRRRPEASANALRALSAEERQEVRAVLNSARICDSSPREVSSLLLDWEGVYLCAWRTISGVLEASDEVHERRRQGHQPKRVTPGLRTTGPNDVRSWSISD